MANRSTRYQVRPDPSSAEPARVRICALRYTCGTRRTVRVIAATNRSLSLCERRFPFFQETQAGAHRGRRRRPHARPDLRHNDSPTTPGRSAPTVHRRPYSIRVSPNSVQAQSKKNAGRRCPGRGRPARDRSPERARGSSPRELARPAAVALVGLRFVGAGLGELDCGGHGVARGACPFSS